MLDTEIGESSSMTQFFLHQLLLVLAMMVIDPDGFSLMLSRVYGAVCACFAKTEKLP